MNVIVTYVGPTQGKPATWSQWVAGRSQRGREVAERSQRSGLRSQRGRRELGLGRREVAENQVKVAEGSQRFKFRSSNKLKGRNGCFYRSQYAIRSQACPGEGLLRATYPMFNKQK